MKHVVHYPKGHLKEGEIVAVFHEHYVEGERARPPDPVEDSEGNELAMTDVPDSRIPDPDDPELNIEADTIDVDKDWDVGPI
jgi:hypothetical protein